MFKIEKRAFSSVKSELHGVLLSHFYGKTHPCGPGAADKGVCSVLNS